MTEDVVYPTAEEVLAIHEDIVERQPDTEPGVRTQQPVTAAIQFVSEGYFGQKPETIHEAAKTLVRRLVAEHPFVDGNKRTALNTVVVLYGLNGYAFEYADDPMRTTLKCFGTDATDVDGNAVVNQFRTFARPVRESNSTGCLDEEYDGTDERSIQPERQRLREQALSTADPAERRETILELAAFDRERNAPTYEKLAGE